MELDKSIITDINKKLNYNAIEVKKSKSINGTLEIDVVRAFNLSVMDSGFKSNSSDP